MAAVVYGGLRLSGRACVVTGRAVHRLVIFLSGKLCLFVCLFVCLLIECLFIEGLYYSPAKENYVFGSEDKKQICVFD